MDSILIFRHWGFTLAKLPAKIASKTPKDFNNL